MENTTKDYSHIKGWGIDADPKNDPTYPMKRRTNEEHLGYSWERPTLQPQTVEILHSNERPNVTAVFGTSTPPSGLSGMIRRLAFKKTENDYGHWLPLILADRINVVEGIIEDLRSGHVPNIFAEKGYKAEWKYNRGGLLRKAAVAAILSYGVVAYFRAKKKRKHNY
ncbi:hypothetical protein ACFSC6_16345 [Rufibacter sediminis]|uniref:ATP synthase subunit f, mitochondrial n=1 Tax=Rufibacter sediminis TaxID=2762756 RepID=A0ABR6VMN7_9BACT|nr:hypothetical protein [Rufibacter sediminis]MBC3538443.1 hypothetical protein [Rufibacter sediminis]